MYDILSKARILIVDDFAQFRLSLKSMLFKLGVRQVNQASNGVEAVKYCMEDDYDIIFCDYNLGDGQDGQQILEELHHRSILLRGSLFLMVTAETTAAQVMGAIEYRPDAYLTKPFTNEQLGQRLKRLLNKNEILKSIHDAINRGNSDGALKLCDEVMVQAPTVRYSCLRIKAEILEQQKKYDAAMELYNDVSEEQPLLWAMLGIGKLYYNKGETEEALQHFIKMKDDFPQQVSVFDWIARCHNTLGELEEAESSLLKAIEISPKSVSRQADLGEIAQSLNHHEVAHKAFEKTIHEGQYSSMLQPQHYSQYFDNTRELATHKSGREQSRLLSSTESVVRKMTSKYQNDATALAVNLSSLAGLFSAVGKTDKSGDYLSRLSTTLEKPDCRISETEFDYIVNNVKKLEEDPVNEKHFNKISSRLDVIKQEIKLQQENDKSAKSINRQGLKLAQQRQSLEALDKFKEAIKLMPQNPDYSLNAAQIILLNDDLKNDPERVEEARSFLTSLSLKNSGKRWRLYKKLMSYLPDD